MKTLILSNMPSVAISSVADGEPCKLLESLEAENAELRDKVVELILHIHALHNGQSNLRSITFSVTGTPVSRSGWPKLQ
jgi:hypothetical protein